MGNNKHLIDPEHMIHDDLEADDHELQGVAYTGISLLGFVLALLSTVVYLVW